MILPLALFGLFFFSDRYHAVSSHGIALMKQAITTNAFGNGNKLTSSHSNGAAQGLSLNSIGGNKFASPTAIVKLSTGVKAFRPLTNNVHHSQINAIPSRHSVANNPMGNDVDSKEEERKEQFYIRLYGKEGKPDNLWPYLTSAFEQSPANVQKTTADLALPNRVALEMLSKLSDLKADYHVEHRNVKEKNKHLGVVHRVDSIHPEYITRMMHIFDNAINQIYPRVDPKKDDLEWKISMVAEIFEEAGKFWKQFIKKETVGMKMKEHTATLLAREIEMRKIHEWLKKINESLPKYEDKEKPSAILLWFVQETSPIPSTSPPRRRTV